MRAVLQGKVRQFDLSIPNLYLIYIFICHTLPSAFDVSVSSNHQKINRLGTNVRVVS